MNMTVTTLRRTRKTTSVGFVNEVLEILETAKVDAAVRNDILNSFIETLPETSFAKNFQKREGTAGFNQNHTQVMRSKIYDIGRQVTRLDYTNRITKLQQQILGTDPDNLDSKLARLTRKRRRPERHTRRVSNSGRVRHAATQRRFRSVS